MIVASSNDSTTERIKDYEDQQKYVLDTSKAEDTKWAAYGDGRFNIETRKPHYHRDERGFLVKCYHKARINPIIAFVVGTMVSFPIEHFLYEKVWPFYYITKWLGL